VVVLRGIASAAIERLKVKSNMAQTVPGGLQLIIHRRKNNISPRVIPSFY